MADSNRYAAQGKPSPGLTACFYYISTKFEVCVPVQCNSPHSASDVSLSTSLRIAELM